METRKRSEYFQLRGFIISHIHHYRQRMLEILNSGEFPSPIIVFVNQKKTADMVAKDLQRGGVIILTQYEITFTDFHVDSGARLLYTQERTKSSEKLPSNPFAAETRTFWWLLIWPAVVSTYRTLVWLSITRCPTLLRHTFIALVRNPTASYLLRAMAYLLISRSYGTSRKARCGYHFPYQ